LLISLKIAAGFSSNSNNILPPFKRSSLMVYGGELIS
jgi:hypothetical protein